MKIWKFKNSLIQEDNKEWEDSFITYHKDHDWSNDKLINKHEHAELVLRMCMQTIWKELSHHTMLQMCQRLS